MYRRSFLVNNFLCTLCACKVLFVVVFVWLYLLCLVYGCAVALVYTVHPLRSILFVSLLQRKDYRVLTECLPSKHEYVLKIRLSPVQEQLYCALLEQRGSDGVIQSIFKFFQVMIRVSGSAQTAGDYNVMQCNT